MSNLVHSNRGRVDSAGLHFRGTADFPSAEPIRWREGLRGIIALDLFPEVGHSGYDGRPLAKWQAKYSPIHDKALVLQR